MKKAVRKTLKISGFVLGALAVLAVIAALLVIFDKPLVRKIVRSRLGKAAGPTVRFDRLDYSIFPFRITVDSLDAIQENAFQKMELSCKRLEAKGDLWKLVRGIRPALDSIEAVGLSFRLEQKAVSEEPLDIEAILLQASDALAWAGRISLTGANLSLSFISSETVLGDLDITLTPGDRRDAVAYSIGRGDLSIKKADGSFLLKTGLASSGTLGLASPFGIDGEFALSAPRVVADGVEDSLAAAAASLACRYDKSTGELAVSRLKVGVPGLIDIDGTAAGTVGKSLFLEAEARARIGSLEAAAAFLGPRLPAEFRAAKLRGRAEVSGKYGIRRSSSETKDNLDASVTLEGVEFDYAIDGHPLRGRAGLSGKYSLRRSGRESRDSVDASLSLEDLEFDQVVGGAPLRLRASGRIDAAGPSSDPRLSADIRSSFGKIAVAGLSVAGSDVRVVGTAAKSGAAISRLDARLTGLAFDAADGKKISFDGATLTGQGSLDLVRKNAVLTSLEAALSGLPPVRLSGQLGFGKSRAAEVLFEGRGLDLPALRTIAAPFVPAGLEGWDIGGTADISLSARRPGAPEDSWGISGKVSLSGASFNDPSFTIAGEGLAPVFTFEGVPTASKGISFAGSLDIGQGESLWKAIYVSWGTHPLKLTVAGRYDPGSGGWDGLALRVQLPTIGRIDVTGTAKMGQVPSFDLKTEASLALGPLYSLYSEAGVSEETRMNLEGKLGADLLLRKDGDALSVGGRIRLAETNVERAMTKTLLLGITADIPVRYESKRNDMLSFDAHLPEEGFLRIGEFQSPFLTLKSVAVSLRAGTNAFSIEPLKLELFGGRLELDRTVVLFDPSSGSFRGLGALVLRDIDVSRFPIQSPQFKLTGKIQADFPFLDISPKNIAVSGRGEASVFGGKIVLRDLAVSDPFAPGRAISLNIDLVDLNLKKLTDEVPFGEVTGILRGEVRNLVITYGQPESFELRVESVPRRGVPQTFSLKAVDDLTVLSSGQHASGGTGQFWMRFIRGFRYRTLGIVSTLHNDTFTLNGTIHDGGVEYLVKKPALFGISVVNRMPDKMISFKEMTGRLKRVGQSEK